MKKKVKVRVTRGGQNEGADLSDMLEGVLLAAAEGKVQELRNYLDRGGNPQIKENDMFGYTLLQLTVLSNNPDAVSVVLQRRPDVNATSDDGTTTALILAARKGNSNIISLLLRAGAHVSTLSSPGAYPLLTAAEHAPDEAPIRLLLRAGASIRAVDPSRESVLHKAVQGRSPRVLRELLTSGATPLANNPSSTGATPLHTALEFHWESHATLAPIRAEMVLLLLRTAHADPNARNPSDGTTPLHIAVMNRATAAAEHLLAHGADVNAADAEGWVPLMGAALDGDVGVVGLLLRHGARMAGPAGDALHAAAERGNARVVRVLLEGGADGNGVGVGEFGTALQAAAYRGRLNTVRNLVVVGGARVEVRGRWGDAVQAAEAGGKREVAGWLRGWREGTVTVRGDQETSVVNGRRVTKRVVLDKDDRRPEEEDEDGENEGGDDGDGGGDGNGGEGGAGWAEQPQQRGWAEQPQQPQQRGWQDQAHFSGDEEEAHCSACGKRFKTANALAQHQRATGHEDDDDEEEEEEEDSDDDDDDDEQCFTCGKSFISRNDLFRHFDRYPRHRV